MVCAVERMVTPASWACAAGYEQQKRKEASTATTFNDIGNFLHAATVKKIRLEPMPHWPATKKIYNQSSVRDQHDLQQFGHSGISPLRAFYLLTDCEREWLQDSLAKETRSQVNHQYLHTTQREIDAHKRLVLVDWLIEVVDEFALSQETLYLSISLLDRFLSQQAVPRSQLQLLGVTCLWVASKYEEVLPPALQDFVDITDNSYAAADLVRMEALLLAQLQYQLAVPTPLHFLHQLLSHAQAEAGCASPHGPCHPVGAEQIRLVHLAEYLLELALLTPDTLRYRPSVIAASALQLAANMLACHCDPSSRAACSNLCRAISIAAATQLDGCMEELRRMHRWAHTALQPPCVRDKYSDSRRSCVAASNLGMWC